MDLRGHGAEGGARERQGGGGEAVTIQLFRETGARVEKEGKGIREGKGKRKMKQFQKTNGKT